MHKISFTLLDQYCKFICSFKSVLLIFLLVGCAEEVSGHSTDSVLDLVTECDLLTAHPLDPERMADGVTDDDIVPKLAIMACENALTESGNEARHLFHMGRAMLAQGRKKDAREYFEKAAKQNYAVAFAYLGDLYQLGLGVSPNPAIALSYYQKALKRKFSAAEEQIKQLTFDSSLFVSNAIGSLYDRTFEINAIANNALLRNYIFNVITNMMEECGSFLKPNSLARFYIFRFPKDKWKIEQEEDIGVSIQTSIGEHDAEIFLERYGCDGPVAKTIFNNINFFFGSYKVK